MSRKGVTRSGKYQIKKHFSAFTVRDKQILLSKLYEIKRLTRSKHFILRQETGDVQISLPDILRTLKNRKMENSIIEYNESYCPETDRITQRVLIRLDGAHSVKSTFQTNRKNKTKLTYAYVVIDLTTSQVITGYHNDLSDKHTSLNMSRYNNEISVRPIKQGGYSVNEMIKVKSNEFQSINRPKHHVQQEQFNNLSEEEKKNQVFAEKERLRKQKREQLLAERRKQATTFTVKNKETV